VSPVSITGPSSLRAGILPMAGTYNARVSMNTWVSAGLRETAQEAITAMGGVVALTGQASTMLSRPYGACPTFVCVPRTRSQNRRTCPGLLSVVLRDLREEFAEESPRLWFVARGDATARVALDSKWLQRPVDFEHTLPPSLFRQDCQSRYQCQPSKAGACLHSASRRNPRDRSHVRFHQCGCSWSGL
jgi:hypothetical protein